MKTKEVSTNRIYIPLLFVIFSIIFEFVNFAYLGFLDSNGNKMMFPSYFVFDLAIIIMIAGFLFLLSKNKVINTFFFIFLSLQLVFNVVNATMYKVFGDILSVDLLKLGEEAANAVTPEFIDWAGTFIHIGVFAVMVVIAAFVMKFNKRKMTIKNFATPVIAFAVFFFLEGFGMAALQLQTNSLPEASAYETEIEGSDKYLWKNFHFKIDAFKKFGHFGFYAKSILGIFTDESLSKEEVKAYQEYIDEGYVEADSSALLYGDNLVVVLCESMDLFAIDPIYTPTLWKIANGYNSYVFTEFYARNRTNISEGIVLNGSMTKDFLFKAYGDDYEFEYSLPHVFESVDTGKETTTSYVHANYASFYQRNKTHKDEKIGFDNIVTIEDYTGDQKYKSFKWISDLSFTQNVMDYILPNDGSRFLTFFASVSTHGSYDWDNKYFTEYYKTYDEHFEEYKTWMEEETDFVMPTNSRDLGLFRRYKSSMMDFDKTIENLISEVEARGLSDNTSILLYADHHAYYHDLNYKIRGLKKSDFSSTYVNHIPMFLYSPHLLEEQGHSEGQFVDSFCNTYDILPTICDLYGLPSNTNMYQGYSIFSKDISKSVFSSNLSGMFTNKLFSMNISDVYITDESATEEDIKAFKENAARFYEKQRIIDIVYKNGINGNIKLKSA